MRAPSCTTGSPRSSSSTPTAAALRLALPFAEKGELTLKKIGLELVVGVGRQRRTIMLPPALAAMQPDGARLNDGDLEVSFRVADEPSGPEDLLARLEARLDRAADVAERLIGEATRSGHRRSGAPSPNRLPRRTRARRTARGRRARPASAHPPRAGRRRGRATGRPGISSSLMQVFGSLRDRIPTDLQRRIAEALRELLLALRALIDWYLERAERRRSEPVVVEDIPIL